MSDLLWIVVISVFSMVRISDPWMSLVNHTVLSVVISTGSRVQEAVRSKIYLITRINRGPSCSQWGDPDDWARQNNLCANLDLQLAKHSLLV